ncbi:Transglycosylase SLT domain-containing protein [Noviherbaspirillum humi]|uniref:Transglycosylase SLT domain-containing protein n=1 Tax=Noviherbaspirillum humi TaxID=1688639 RepID=A0A239DH40_9BURK|nr:transglycosylase SLT domain-containing protein [Noviherbaspirillum humi]SNS31657.1 Transglycosylase SLT domain-containing protein [Noviherbaspirillum humi]
MVNRFFRATSDFARRQGRQTATLVVVTSETVNRFIKTAHHTVMLLGVLSLGTLGILFVNPDMADHVKALSPFAVEAEQDIEEEPQQVALTEAKPAPSEAKAATATEPAQAKPVAVPSPLPETLPKAAANSKQEQWVTNWLSKRYRVATDATHMLVSAAYMTAREIKLDPLLILSVMAIESGLNPFAESPVGAQGLMQVMSKVHRDKFERHGGPAAALNPIANIKVGSMILKDYVSRGGSVEAGLKLYVGAGAFENDSGYGSKVMAEYRRLKDVAMGKSVPTFTAPSNPSPAIQKPKSPEIKQEGGTTVQLEKNNDASMLINAYDAPDHRS